METSLHRQLKRLYAGPGGRTEIRLGRYRIDAVTEDDRGQVLIEIQHGSLAAIRDKVRQLTRRRRVLLVKPIIGRKRLIRCAHGGGPVIGERTSPRQGRLLEVFDELIYFTRAFPHRNLSVEVVLVDIEEWRLPPAAPSGRRRRRWLPKFAVEDQKLVAIRETVRLVQAADLKQLIDCALPMPFHTAHLAAALGVKRWTAQRIAYVLRQVGATTAVGKLRGARLYRWSEEQKTRRAA